MRELALLNFLPGATVYVTIRAADDTVLIATGGSAGTFGAPVSGHWPTYAIALTEDPSSPGDYYGDWPAGPTSGVVYRVVYQTQSGASPASTDEIVGEERATSTPSYAPSTDDGDLITLADYQTFVGDTDSTKATKRSMLITMVSEGVRSYLQCGVLAQDRVERHDGTGDTYLHLDSRPVNSITTVTLDPDGANPTVVAGSNFVANSSGTIRFKGSASPGYFPMGFQNIEITYNCGYSTLPNDLKMAVLLAVQTCEQLSSVDRFKTGERVRDVSVTYANIASGDFSSSMFEGVAIVLNKYRQVLGG